MSINAGNTVYDIHRIPKKYLVLFFNWVNLYFKAEAFDSFLYGLSDVAIFYSLVHFSPDLSDM
jgi:hypothetical protein